MYGFSNLTIWDLLTLTLVLGLFGAIFLRLAKFGRRLEEILEQGKQQREAREQMVTDIRDAAEKLALETQKALTVSEASSGVMRDSIDENTLLTKQAAAASAEAARVANDVNEKIADTNQQLINMGKKDR